MGTLWTVITIAIAAAALAVSIVLGLRSARASERSAKAGEMSAVVAAEAAAKAAAMALNDREREHRHLDPGPIPAIETTLTWWNPERPDPDMPRTLRGTIGGLPRDYRVEAIAVAGDSFSSISLPNLVLRADLTYPFQIESWPAGRQEPLTDYILFRFWPAVDADGVPLWACPCDRPADDKQGHWERRAQVQSPPAGE